MGLCRNVTAVRLFSADQLDFASVNLCIHEIDFLRNIMWYFDGATRHVMELS